jgi:hypothetical protein
MNYLALLYCGKCNNMFDMNCNYTYISDSYNQLRKNKIVAGGALKFKIIFALFGSMLENIFRIKSGTTLANFFKE